MEASLQSEVEVSRNIAVENIGPVNAYGKFGGLGDGDEEFKGDGG